MMKKKKAVLIALLAIAILTVSGALVYWRMSASDRQMSPAIIPSVTPSSGPTAGWVSYVNEKHGYCIEYPPTAELVPLLPGNNEDVIGIYFSFQPFVIRVFDNPEGLSARDWAEAELKHRYQMATRGMPQPKVFEKEAITQNGFDIYRLTYHAVDHTGEHRFVAIDNKILRCSFATADNPGDSKAEEHYRMSLMIFNTLRMCP